MNSFDTNGNENNSRRAFLTQAVGVGVGVAALALSGSAMASTTPHQPEADTGHDYPMPAPHAKDAKAFYMGVIGPATLSHITSEIAVDKATNPAAKEFANFELREAIGVLTVLKEMGTPTPPMNATSKAILEKIKTSEGAEFDKAYMSAQLANHEFLRDLAATYLNNSAGHTGMPEMHGRHIATLAQGLFKEHVVHCKNILGELKA